MAPAAPSVLPEPVPAVPQAAPAAPAVPAAQAAPAAQAVAGAAPDVSGAGAGAEVEAEERLRQGLAAVQDEHEPSAVIVVEIDGVNAAFSPEVADAVMNELEARLVQARRRSDVVARVGDERFVVVCGHVGSDADADRVAGSLVGALNRPLTFGAVEHRVNPTLGVALGEPAEATIEVLLAHAEAALRRAKHEGRPWSRFDAQADDSPTHQRLRSAIANGELHVEYQPVVDILTFRTVGAEVLLRWRPAGELVQRAAEFLEQAYEAGLAKPIGEFVLASALAELGSWRVIGSVPEGFRMWVNVSAEEIADPSFAGTVEKLCRDHGVSPSMLSLEVPESDLSEIPRSANALRALSELGVSFVIDDFGSGHSDLRSLRDLPVTGIKLTPELVDSIDVEEDRRGAALVRAAIAFGRELRLDVVAEGVETQAQAIALRAMGCDLAQGYFFGRPGPSEDLGVQSPRFTGAS